MTSARVAGPAVLVGALLVSACGATETATPSSETAKSRVCGSDVADLRELAEQRGKTIGTAYRSTFAEGDPCYAAVAGTAFNSVTTEIGTMTNTVAPGPGRFDFREADAVAEFARKNKQDFQIHSLVWDPLDQQVWGIVPGYVKKMSTDGRRVFLNTLVTMVVKRYAGRASTVTVVNEPFDQSGRLQQNTWWQIHRSDQYIFDAFRAARSADPTMKLYLNEHSSETVSDKSTALLDLARRLRAQTVEVQIDGRPVRKPLIDGVGFQAHMLGGADQQPRIEDMRTNMRRFVDAGLDVRLTELDVRIPTEKGVSTAADLNRQGDVYRTMTGLCREFEACTGVTVWGFTDKRSWITDYPATFSGYGNANVLGAAYQVKPAWNGVEQALR